jgi:DNA-binding XRE family transcriptional regulator
MRADDPTLPDRIHLRTLVEHGLAPMLKKEPMEILRGMLGEELPPEPVFVNLTAEQLERCIQAAQRALSPAPQPAPVPAAVPVESFRDRLALNTTETAKALGVSKVTVYRLWKRGLLRPSLSLRTPLFAVSEIERFLRSSAGIEETRPRSRKRD